MDRPCGQAWHQGQIQGSTGTCTCTDSPAQQLTSILHHQRLRGVGAAQAAQRLKVHIRRGLAALHVLGRHNLRVQKVQRRCR